MIALQHNSESKANLTRLLVLCEITKNMRKKLLLSCLALSLSGYLSAQTPIEKFSFTGGSLNGEISAVPIADSSSSTMVEDADGVLNSALSLDGTETITYDGLSLNPYNGIAVSFWVKPSSSMTEDAGHAIFSQRTVCTGVNSIESFVNPVDGIISFTLRRSSGAVGVNTTYTPDTWQHFTFTFNPTDGKMRVYKNGVYAATGTNSVGESSIPTSISGDFEIAGHPCEGVDGTELYAGAIDELTFYDERLSELDVMLLWDDAVDLQAYRDSIVNNSLIEAVDFTSFLEDKAAENNYVSDSLENAYSAQYFDGATGASYSSFTGMTNGYTISFWLKPDDFPGGSNEVIFSQRSACSGNNSIEVYRGADEVIFVARTTGGGKGIRIPYTANEWAKFTFVADRSLDSLYGYKNGQLEVEDVANSRIASSLSTTTLRVGTSICVGRDATQQYSGVIDELFIYNQNLTSEEILQAYTESDNDQFLPYFTESFDLEGVSLDIRNDLISGEDDTAAVFDGTQGFNMLNSDITTDGDGFTFSFWVKPDGSATATDQILFSRRYNCDPANVFAVVVDGTAQTISMEFETIEEFSQSLSLDFTADQWQLVTYVVDFNSLQLYGYIDGAIEDSVSITYHDVQGAYSDAVAINLSSSPCTHSNYVGSLDEVEFYSAPFSGEEVRYIYDESPITGLLENEEVEYALEIYPNPSNNTIFVEEGDLIVLDQVGNLMMSIYQTGSVDVSSLNSGIYIVSVNGKKAKLVVE